MGWGARWGGVQEHITEVAELMWKDRFYRKLFASWISVCTVSFCFSNICGLLWMLSIKWLDIFKQEHTTKLFWELIQVFLALTMKTLALCGFSLFLCSNSWATFYCWLLVDLPCQSWLCKVQNARLAVWQDRVKKQP